MVFVTCLVVLIGLLPHCTLSYEAGAPTSRCGSMMPKHSSMDAQTGPTPYTITTSAPMYKCGESITVTLAATSGSFRGFLCEARTDVTDNTTVVGTLAASGTVSMGEPCGSGKGLTHTEKSDKRIAVFTWTGNKNYGSVKVVCTIVKIKVEFWVHETSTAITYAEGGQCDDGSHVIASVTLMAFLLLASHVI